MSTGSEMLRTPVVLIIFNRPDLTRRVMQAVAQVRPRTLFVVADGPRRDHPSDATDCAAARVAVEDAVTWNCDVRTCYSDINLGCGTRPATGIDWVFEQVQDAIILEDDCVPHASFFAFCEELLDRYRDDERVMHIAGSTYRASPMATPYSYFFSQFNGAWGWATWQRAWRHFDARVCSWPMLRSSSWLADVVEHPRAVHYWANVFDGAFERQGHVSYWDHQWTFACWANSGLSIMPRVNLVSNIGCGPGATHMSGAEDAIANLPAHEMTFPLSHPPHVLQLRSADREFLRAVVLPRLHRPSAARVLVSRLAPPLLKRSLRRVAAAMQSA